MPLLTEKKFWILVKLLHVVVEKRLFWGEYQNDFIKAGLLEPEFFDPEIHQDQDGCFEPGDTIYVLAPALKPFFLSEAGLPQLKMIGGNRD